MRIRLIIPLILILHSGIAHSNVSKKEMLRKLDSLYEKVMNSKKNNYQAEYDVINGMMEQNFTVEISNRFICSKGTFDDEYFVFDKTANKKIGREMTFNQCNAAVKAARNGLVCGRGTFQDEFQVYNSKTGNFLGEKATTYNQCMTAVKSTKNNMVCIRGTFQDEFHLHNLETNQDIGGKTKFHQCLSRL